MIPQTGLPVRTQDFLKALDTIVDAAIEERVDLVLFAGDAYKDRTPVPTFQREWGGALSGFRRPESRPCCWLAITTYRPRQGGRTPCRSLKRSLCRIFT